MEGNQELHQPKCHCPVPPRPLGGAVGSAGPRGAVSVGPEGGPSEGLYVLSNGRVCLDCL